MTAVSSRRGRVWVLGAVVLLWAPFLPLLLRAVAGTSPYPEVVPSAFTGRGLAQAFAPSGRVLEGLVLSGLTASAVAVLACAVAWPAARVLGQHRFRGRGLVQLLLLAPVVVPPMAATMGLQVFFIRLGLAHTAFGVALVQLAPALPYAIFVLEAGFANFDRSYERQAQALGARRLRRWWSLTLPLMLPWLVAAAVLAFLVSWSDYTLTLLVGGGQVQTLPILLFAAVGSSDTTLAASLGLLVMLPPIVLTAAAARHLSGGSPAEVAIGGLR